MKSQQLKAFIHSYINDQNNLPPYTIQHFMNSYSKEFCVDISYLDTDALYIRLTEDTVPESAFTNEITFDMLLRGITQGYLDNKTIDKVNKEALSPIKQKFTTKQIIIAVLIVAVSSALLGMIAIYS